MTGGVVHEKGRVNARLTLCQEYAMLTGEYDEKARVDSPGPDMLERIRYSLPFVALVEEYGSRQDAAAAVESCYWMSDTDIADWHDQRRARERGDDPPPPVDCRECAEVRHA